MPVNTAYEQSQLGTTFQGLTFINEESRFSQHLSISWADFGQEMPAIFDCWILLYRRFCD